MEFCNKCGSLKMNGNCTNKKCDQHIKSLVEMATSKQVDYIKELAEQLNEDISDFNFENMSKTDAEYLIDEYQERLEDTEKKFKSDDAIIDDEELNGEDIDE